MLRIFNVCLWMLEGSSMLGGAQIESKRGSASTQHDKDLARQLKRASSSVALNVAEGAAVRDGRRRARYGDALGSALESRAAIRVAVAIGYVDAMPPQLAGRFRHIIRVLEKVTLG